MCSKYWRGRVFLVKVATPSVYLAMLDLSIAYQRVCYYLTMHNFHQLLHKHCSQSADSDATMHNAKVIVEVQWADADDDDCEVRVTTIGNQCDRTSGALTGRTGELTHSHQQCNATHVMRCNTMFFLLLTNGNATQCNEHNAMEIYAFSCKPFNPL